MSASAGDILSFWFGNPGDEDFDDKGSWWFTVDAALDAEIDKKFRDAYEDAATGKLDDWMDDLESCLALIILLDQFSRNLFRGSAQAFAADAKARSVAGHAIEKGYDQGYSKNRKLFTYLPFEHAENLVDQNRAVELVATLDDDYLLDFAVQHRDIIEQYGRFPHRNAVLGRESTADELKLLEDPKNSFGQNTPDEADSDK